MVLAKLFFIYLCLFYPICSIAYTVVLKSGKHITGDVLKEDDQALHLRDNAGVVLVFKKGNLDLNQMAEVNKPDSPDALTESNKEPQKVVDDPPLKTVTAQKQSSEKKAVRVLKIEDLEKMPEVSVIGTDEPVKKDDQQKTKAQTREEPTVNLVGQRQAWNDRAKKFRSEIDHLKKKQAEAEVNCEKTGGRRSFEKAGSSYYPNANCKTADDLLEKIDETEENFRLFRGEADAENIPLDWIQD